MIEAICEAFGTRLGLQRDSVRNQAEHIDVLWNSFLSRHSDDASAALQDLWTQLLRTQAKWREQVWVPLTSEAPHTDLGDQCTDDQALQEICLFLLLWGELGNLRFCPEVHCFLFSAARSFCLPLDQSPRDRPAEGSFLRGIVRPMFTTILEETFNPGAPPKFKFGNAPAPGTAANYDDWNELFWDAKRLSQSLRLKDGGLLMDSCTSSSDVWSMLHDVDWVRTLRGQKSHYELHSFLPVLVGSYRVFLLQTFILGMLLTYPQGSSMWKIDNWEGAAPVALLIPFWMAIYEFGYLFLTPATRCSRWFRGILKLLVPYSLPIATYVLVFLSLQTDFKPNIFSVSLSGWRNIVLIVHYAVTLIALIAALGQQSSNPSAWGFYPGALKGSEFGPWCFWFVVLLLGTLCSSILVSACRDALNGLWELHGGGESGPVMLWAENIVLFVPTGLCFLASLLFFTNLGIAFTGAILGVYRLGGFKLWCYRRGLGFSRLPRAVSSRLLRQKKDSQHPREDSWRKVSTWWDRMSLEEIKAFATVWDEMVGDLRAGDLINDEQESSLKFGPDGAIRAKSGQVPRLLDPRDVFRISNALPYNKEARRRLVALARSIQMRPLPKAKVRTMPSLTVLIPHYAEDILFQRENLFQQGAPQELLRFLVKYYRIDFQNFSQRCVRAVANGEATPAMPRISSTHTTNSQRSNFRSYLGYRPTPTNDVALPADLEKRLCEWASLRMQTLWRTIQGVSESYTTALDSLLRVQEPDLGGDARENIISEKLQVLLAMQRYGLFSDPSRVKDGHALLAATEALLLSFGQCLKIAYIDEEDGPEGKRYFSCLIDNTCKIVQMPGRLPARQPLYRIELPGFPILGHGKSDNQNCAVIFSRGEVLQMIDCNQEAYFESSLFLPSALQEFGTTQDGRRPGILGFREHIFSDIGLVGRLAADSEFAFGTVIQRTMDWPLRARLHYGHPDMMCKLQAMQQGGVSKGTKGLNLSEDVFAGIDLVLRGGWTTYKEYFYVGKGRDMGFMSVLSFFAKVSMGNGEQAITRQWLRLGLELSLPRYLGVFHIHIGYYLNQCLINWAIKAFAFMAASFALLSSVDLGADDAAVGSVASYFSLFYVLLTATTLLPLLFEVWIENGLCASLRMVASSSFGLSPIFAAFQSKLMGYYFWCTLHYGGAQYIATGRGLATSRESFLRLFRTFGATHMHDAFELILYLLISLTTKFNWGFYAVVSFIIVSWMFAPFIFNPRQFDSTAQAVKDTKAWLQWMYKAEGKEDESWVAWSTQLQSVRKTAHVLVELTPSGRFLAVVCTTLLAVYNHRFSVMVQDMRWTHWLIVLPPVGYLLLCIAGVFIQRICCCGGNCSFLTYPFLAALAIGVTFMELSAMEFWPGTWRLALFHKYICARWMLELADGVAVRQPCGWISSVVHDACRIWALSWRFSRDLALGLLVSGFCITFTVLPGTSVLHEFFLFRAHLRREPTTRKKEERARADSSGSSSASDEDGSLDSGSDFDGGDGSEDPVYAYVRRFAGRRKWVLPFRGKKSGGGANGGTLNGGGEFAEP